MVGDAVAAALMRVALDTGVPVINGVVVVNNLAQAEARTIGAHDRGAEFAAAALEMAALKKNFS
jgi:6,7-dimethyl-8-ribityllumazine synthase